MKVTRQAPWHVLHVELQLTASVRMAVTHTRLLPIDNNNELSIQVKPINAAIRQKIIRSRSISLEQITKEKFPRGEISRYTLRRVREIEF